VTTAIVTMAIGGVYLRRWRDMCELGWRAYAERHGYDLIVVDQPMDASPRAKGRSPSWQKCLILDPSIAGAHDRVVWVDSDILINPAAPPITKDVPIEAIGAVDEHVFPSVAARLKIIARLIEHWRGIDERISRNWASFLDPAEWHAFAGLPKRGRHMLQAGVLVLSPRHHRELLEHVYHRYEDTGGEQMNYEMRPLSFEIQERNLQHLLDARFNALVSMLLLQKEMELGRGLSPQEITALLTSEYRRNHFLHFAGRHELMVGRAVPQPPRGSF
jgi:hypothetical protein